MVDLDAMIRRARNAAVRRDVAEAHIRELERWTVQSEPRRWPAWLAVAAAGAVAVALAVMVVRGDGSPDIAPIRIGDRVALVAEPGTSYRIVRASGDDTAIEVERGAVTARLWQGARPHHLTLQGGGVVATANGTVYSLTVERGSASVHVDEGTVDVQVGAAVHTVAAGASWPPDRVRASGRASSLLALAPPPRAPAHPYADDRAASHPAAPDRRADAADADATSPTISSSGSPAAAPAASPSATPAGDSGTPASAPIASTHAAPSPATASAPARSPPITAPPPAVPAQRANVSAAAAPSPRANEAPPQRADIEPARTAAIKDRWRLARKLRTEGKLRAAVAECLAIADARDPTWSPIAIVEAIRLYAGPLADSAQVIGLADRVIHEWPADTLIPEARQQRCRALYKLGRGGECAAPPRP
jgi:hypothetical protein